MVVIIMLGRITRFLPENFEMTGITSMISISNIGLISSGLIAAKEISAFKVHAGHYERLVHPMLLNTYMAIALMLVYPLFVVYRLKRNKLKSVNQMMETTSLSPLTRTRGSARS
jgi:hypothetical protein